MDAGLIAQDIGEEYGGKGSTSHRCSRSRRSSTAPTPASRSRSSSSWRFGCEMVEQYGTDEQKEEYLRPVAENDQISGLAVSEPETGSDLAGMTTKAEKVDGGYELTGEKYWVGNAVEADWLTVYAKTGDSEDRYSNYTLFIVETDSDGYEAEHIPEKMGMRASKQGHIVFEDCFVPEENVVGSEGGGFYVLADFFNHGRVIIVGGHGLGSPRPPSRRPRNSSTGATPSAAPSTSSRRSNTPSRTCESASSRLARSTARACEKVADNDNAGYWAALAKTKSTEVATDCAERG